LQVKGQPPGTRLERGRNLFSILIGLDALLLEGAVDGFSRITWNVTTLKRNGPPKRAVSILS
jgi:hypothetical protein